MKTDEIAAWQRDFFAAPAVWAVFDRDDILSDLYESKEAAQLDVDRNPRRRIVKYHVHSLALAERRWGRLGDEPAPKENPDGPRSLVGTPYEPCARCGRTKGEHRELIGGGLECPAAAKEAP